MNNTKQEINAIVEMIEVISAAGSSVAEAAEQISSVINRDGSQNDAIAEALNIVNAERAEFQSNLQLAVSETGTLNCHELED